MFLRLLQQRNEEMLRACFNLYNNGKLLPDTYVLDLDVFIDNAKALLLRANELGIKLYFMLKQLGHNPYLAKILMELGYEGAVCVDFEEALILKNHGIKISHLGHLVQVPKPLIKAFIELNPEIITVYSLEKILQINEVSAKLSAKSKIMLRVIEEADLLYPSQEAGFSLEEIPALVEVIKRLDNVELAGVCSFPCFLFSQETKEVEKTSNLDTVLAARDMLEKNHGYSNLQINLPSANSADMLEMIVKAGGTHAEPGHALTGTAPYHAHHTNATERPALAYVSEVSHKFRGLSYCYGGGHYRRGNMKEALVGKSFNQAKFVKVFQPQSDSIDYHFGLEAGEVSDIALFSFRTQIFVTRSKLAIVKGIQSGKPEIIGLFTSGGIALEKGEL